MCPVPKVGHCGLYVELFNRKYFYMYIIETLCPEDISYIWLDIIIKRPKGTFNLVFSTKGKVAFSVLKEGCCDLYS